MGGQKLGGWVFYFLVCSLHYKVSASADDFMQEKEWKRKEKNISRGELESVPAVTEREVGCTQDPGQIVSFAGLT